MRIIVSLVLLSSLIVNSASSEVFEIDVANDVSTSGGFTTNSDFILGQTYIPSASFLDHVELKVNKQTTQDVTFHVNIREDGPSGVILGTSDAFTVTIKGTPVTLAHIKFNTPVVMTTGATHFIEIVQTSFGSLGVFFASGYIDGMAYSEILGGFQPTSDFWFRTGTTSSSIPKLSTMRKFSPNNYSSPGMLEVSVTVAYSGTEAITSLAVSETIPANWSFDSVTSASGNPEIKPVAGTSGTLQFSWITIPSFPTTLTYRLEIPAEENGIKPFTGELKYRTTGDELTQSIDGDHEIDLASFHDADQNQDFEIQLSPELTRLIQFFNSGGYHCQEGTEDGFAPGVGSEDCSPHDADQNGDFEIQLSPELTRLIQFFNSGGYHLESGTEDGFAPGKPVSSTNEGVGRLLSFPW